MTFNRNDIIRMEVNYRGIFQKTLGKHISTDIVYIAHSEEKTAFSNGRYSDDPQRNGVPCANFAYFSKSLSEEDLEAEASAAMDIKEAELVIVLDDTMSKGLEPWGHYGIRPINEKVVEDGIILFVSNRIPRELMKWFERKPFGYRMAILPGDASFSGLWYFKDDMTDVRVLGAIAKLNPKIATLASVLSYVRKKYKLDQKVEAAKRAFEEVTVIDVNPEDGIVWPHQKPVLPGWEKFEEGILVKGVKRGFALGLEGQSRNPDFKRDTNRTQRPTVRFDLCTKCTLCWASCPDGAFDPTKDGYYDVNYEYCTGCGRCADVCPVDDCIIMVDEMKFDNNDSHYRLFAKDPQSYVNKLEAIKGNERIIPEHITGRGIKIHKVEKTRAFKRVN